MLMKIKSKAFINKIKSIFSKKSSNVKYIQNSSRYIRRNKKADAVAIELEDIEKNIENIDGLIIQCIKKENVDEDELQRLRKQKDKLCKERVKHKDKIQRLRQTRIITITRRKSLFGLAFVAPWIIGFVLLFIQPFIQTIRLSLGEIVDLKSYSIQFTGFSQYSRILYEETDVLFMLLDVLKESFINMIMITIFSFYIAMLLNRKIRFRGIFRVICFLPVILGNGYIMQQLLAQDITQSSMQAVMDFILPKEIIMYIGPKISNAVVFFLNELTIILWHSGVQILLFLSGLQSIPPSLYEAARVDGSTEWESLWFITVPMMTPMILLNLVFTIIETFNDSSNDIISYMQTYAFEHNQFSYSAAIGVFFMLFSLLLIGLSFLITNRYIKNVEG